MEGGGIATSDDEFANDLRSMRSHGWSRDRSDVSDWTEQISANDSKFLFVSTGYNVRPMEIQAAIGSIQIEKIQEFVDKRRSIANAVSNALIDTNMKVIGAESLFSQPETNSWMLIPILVTGPNASSEKKLIIQNLEKLEIETRPVLTGNFLAQPAIQRITRHSVDPESFEVASEITNSAFLIGAHHDLTSEQIDFLCSSLRKVSTKNGYQ
jgi:CDP-6-deoxy-D-xylo-4-hexulose-3-dehydrase